MEWERAGATIRPLPQPGFADNTRGRASCRGRKALSGLDLHGHCSSRETRFLALTSGTRNQHHIGFGKHLSCLGGEEHRVMLLLAFRANEPRPLNRSVVAMSMHLRR